MIKKSTIEAKGTGFIVTVKINELNDVDDATAIATPTINNNPTKKVRP